MPRWSLAGGWARRAKGWCTPYYGGFGGSILPTMVPAMALTYRFPTRDDLTALTALMEAAIGDLQAEFLSPAQVAAVAGHPLYAACGYAPITAFADTRGGAPVPLIRMGKTIG